MAAMENARCAVHKCGTAFFVSIALVTLCSSWSGKSAAQAAAPPPPTALDLLAQQAAELVKERADRPIGRVTRRRRASVSVLLTQTAPAPGTRLEVVRRTKAAPAGQTVAALEVVSRDAGVAECREVERSGWAHAEAGDQVRLARGAVRLLVAPCVSIVDLPAEVADVIGETLRGILRAGSGLRIVDDLDAERRAEAAYLSAAVGDFLSQQEQVDEVLYPVLLRTESKLILNLEYFAVERGRATDIDVAAVALDDMLRSWLRAGRSGGTEPPGCKRLTAQTYPWRVLGLAAGPEGSLVVVDSDSVHVLEFRFPGLRLLGSVALGPRQRSRRQAYVVQVTPQELGISAGTSRLGPALYLLSDERVPLSLVWGVGSPEEPGLQVRPAPLDLETVLERLWTNIRGPQPRRQEARWWPTPDQTPGIVMPCFADLDQDARPDLVWSGSDGALRIKLAAQRSSWSFLGFGDVKAVQPPAGAGARAVLWLTDPVSRGAPDRLQWAELAGDNLQVVWTSEPFAGTLVALCSLPLNADAAMDLVAAEAVSAGTRLHVFLALGGERAAPPPPATPAGTTAADSSRP